MKKVLQITPNFNYSCGRSKLVYQYLKHFCPLDSYEFHFITNGGDSINRLNSIKRLKLNIINFTTGYKNYFYAGSFFGYLRKYIPENQIDLIHTHHRFPEIISVKIAREFNVKTITTAHSLVKGYKKLSFQSDKIFSVSNYVTSHLIDYYKIANERIITLNNPVENKFEIDFSQVEKFKRENNILPHQKILLFVGRLSLNKGCDKLLEAFRLVRKKMNNICLIVNGQIEDKNFRPASISNTENLIYVPPQDDNTYLYFAADIVVLPSRIDPFPFVMLEAGAFKKPFIGGNTGGIAEFIEDEKNGLLVDPENPEQLAQKISYLLANLEIGKSLGENLHSKVSRLCDYNNYFNEVEKIYNSLIHRDDF